MLAGDSRWAWVYVCCAAAAFAAYLLGVWLLDRRSPRLVHVAVLAAAIQLAPLAAPLIMSSDPWTYWDYGRIVTVHDANPYVDPPADFPDDPAFPYVGEDWRDTTSVYGPVFTLASEPVALAVGTSADAAAWVFKALAALFVLAATGLAAFLARRRAFACAFVGWNPLLALHFAGGGHNDAWMAALVMAALAAGVVGRRQWAGVAWVLAVLVKWIPLVFLPLRALEARAQGRRVGHVGFALAAAALAAVAFWQFGWHWLGAARPLAENATRETTFSIPSRLCEPRDAGSRRARAGRRRVRRRVRVAGSTGLGWSGASGADRVLPAAGDAVSRAVVRDLGAAARGCGGRPDSAGY